MTDQRREAPRERGPLWSKLTAPISLRRLATRLLLLAISSSVSVAAGELVLRSSASRNTTIRMVCGGPGTVAESYDRIAYLPLLLSTVRIPAAPLQSWNGFVLNSKGFRTPEYRPAKRPGTLRMVVVGDSFAFDSGTVPYPLHFLTLMEAELSRALGRPVEIVNLGVPSCGPALQKRVLALEGLRLQPDLVLWTFFVGNDFTDPLAPRRETARASSGCSLCSLRLIEFFRELRNVEFREPADLGGGGPGTYHGDPAQYDPDLPTFARRRFLEIQAARMGIYDQRRFPERAWKALESVLAEGETLCRRAPVPLVVVVIPDENQINPQLRAEVLAELGRREADYDFDLPQQKVRDACDRYGWSCLDLLQAFRSGGDGLYTLQDTHWSAKGNRLAADVISRYLTRSGLLVGGSST